MTITLDPQLEERVRKAAESEHVPMEQYVIELLERDVPSGTLPRAVDGSEPSAKNLVELFADSPLKGLNLAFERNPSPVRDLSF